MKSTFSLCVALVGTMWMGASATAQPRGGSLEEACRAAQGCGDLTFQTPADMPPLYPTSRDVEGEVILFLDHFEPGPDVFIGERNEIEHPLMAWPPTFEQPEPGIFFDGLITPHLPPFL